MKLYTEEQVRSAMYLYDKGDYITHTQVLNQLTPIELPSDEEIENQAKEINGKLLFVPFNDRSFFYGAYWMRGQIIKANDSATYRT